LLVCQPFLNLIRLEDISHLHYYSRMTNQALRRNLQDNQVDVDVRVSDVQQPNAHVWSSIRDVVRFVDVLNVWINDNE
jgi:hypothetical protein